MAADDLRAGGATGDLTGRAIGVDARYLKRDGIGISRYLRKGIEDLAAAGAKTTLLTDDEQHGTRLRIRYPALEVVVLPGRSGLRWEQRTLPRHLAAARYDAYVAPANYGLPLAYRGRTTLILVVHDLIPLRLPHLYLLARPLWAVKYLLSTVISGVRADHVIAVSNATARDVRRFLRRRVSQVAYPPVPGLSGPPSPDVAVPEAITESTGPYFVYNGGADVRKNVPMLLDALAIVAAEVPAARLVILGAGYERFGKRMEQRDVAGRVLLLGYVPDAVKDAVLGGAAALVYPSRIEGFGLPLVEAMAAGIPVISGTGGSLTEVGGDAIAYPRPLDARSLARAMAAALPEGRRARAAAAGKARLTEISRRPEAGTLASAVSACLTEAPKGRHCENA